MSELPGMHRLMVTYVDRGGDVYHRLARHGDGQVRTFGSHEDAVTVGNAMLNAKRGSTAAAVTWFEAEVLAGDGVWCREGTIVA